MAQTGHMLNFLMLVLMSIVRLSDGTVYSCNASVSCGCAANSATVSRIVGGETASAQTWTWAVSISLYDEFVCGGSIISESWVVTAAHCVYGYSASQITIYAGSTVVSSGTQMRTVSQAVVHPSYDSRTYENDIALLKLATPLSMSDSYVSKICIPSVSSVVLSAGEWPPAGIDVVVVGWGTLTEGGSLPLNLQQVTVQTVDYRAATCNSSVTDWHAQFCAGVSGGGKDSCQGDSGGPLMMFSSTKQWVLVGVVSSGYGCARAEYSGVYTRVAAFTSWILSYTNTSDSTLTPPTSSAVSVPVQTTSSTVSVPVQTTSSAVSVPVQTTSRPTSFTTIHSLGNTFTTSMFNIIVLFIHCFFH